MGAHGFNIWASTQALSKHPFTNKSCDIADVMEALPCAQKGGPLFLTKEMSAYSIGGYRHTHHPPTGQHLLRGEIMAYNYAHILLDAIYTLQEGLSEKKSMSALNQGKSMSLMIVFVCG